MEWDGIYSLYKIRLLGFLEITYSRFMRYLTYRVKMSNIQTTLVLLERKKERRRRRSRIVQKKQVEFEKYFKNDIGRIQSKSPQCPT